MRSAAREDFADIVARKRRQRLEVVEDIGPAVTGVPVAPPAAHAEATAPEVGLHEWGSVSVVPPPDRLCLDLALSAWEVGDLGHIADLSNAAVSIVVAGHPIFSHTLLWPALVVEPAP